MRDSRLLFLCVSSAQFPQLDARTLKIYLSLYAAVTLNNLVSLTNPDLQFISISNYFYFDSIKCSVRQAKRIHHNWPNSPCSQQN